MELKKITIDSKDKEILEKINEEAIPENERNTLDDLMKSFADITGIYEDSVPVGFIVSREKGNLIYLAYLAIRHDLRSNGLGSKALQALTKSYPDKQIVVEYEAPRKDSPAADMNVRRKNFYKRNGFKETGWFTYYDECEFEIGCANKEFNILEFNEFTKYLSRLCSDHIPEPYQK